MCGVLWGTSDLILLYTLIYTLAQILQSCIMPRAIKEDYGQVQGCPGGQPGPLSLLNMCITCSHVARSLLPSSALALSSDQSQIHACTYIPLALYYVWIELYASSYLHMSDFRDMSATDKAWSLSRAGATSAAGAAMAVPHFRRPKI